jgi:SAM-dependent methyltransferase
MLTQKTIRRGNENMKTYRVPKATWPLQLPPNTSQERVDEIRRHVEELASSAQYGWGHSIDFGRFQKKGFLGDSYLDIAGALDSWAWWPKDLTGQAVADVGCFTGGLTLYLAARNPSVVYAVDELPDHLAQCAYLAEVFQMKGITPVESSLFYLLDELPENSLDLALMAGVLYHLSDMLVGLYVMSRLIKPGGTLLLESNAVNDFKCSYANFGRFYKGMWWQPSGLCIEDMCALMGFEDVEVRFHAANRCIARATRATGDIPFKRGMHWRFASLEDAQHRSTDAGIMAPVRVLPQLAGIPHRVAGRLRRTLSRGTSA